MVAPKCIKPHGPRLLNPIQLACVLFWRTLHVAIWDFSKELLTVPLLLAIDGLERQKILDHEGPDFRALKILQSWIAFELIRPATIAIGEKHWHIFVVWMNNLLGDETSTAVWMVPQLLATMLAAFGRHWFSIGGSFQLQDTF